MNKRQAINNFCKSCNYDCNDNGTWRQQIDSCQTVSCDLFLVRPTSSKSTGERDNKLTSAIKNKCFDCLYDDEASGTKHDQTTNCPHITCELYEFRPLNSKVKAIVKEEKISKMTPEQLVKYKAKQDIARINMSQIHSKSNSDSDL